MHLPILALALALTLATPAQRAAGEPLPSAVRGRGALGVSGDGRFGLFAGRRELVTWELASGKKRLRVPLAPGPWELAPSPDGETVLLVAPDRLTEVMLLTGRVVVDVASRPDTPGGAREVAWTGDGSQLLLLGWELPELAPGEGTPLAYLEPRLGYVARQIRIPGLVESRGMVVRPSGFDVVIATPRRLILLGLGVASIRTVALADPGELRLVTALADGVLALRDGALVVIDPDRGAIVRRVGPPLAPDVRLAARPLGRWLVATSETTRTLACIDAVSGVVAWLDPRALGTPRAVLPLVAGIVALGRDARTVDLDAGVPTAIVQPQSGRP